MSDENITTAIKFLESGVQFVLDTLEEEIGKEGVADTVKDHLEEARVHLEISHAVMVLKTAKSQIKEKEDGKKEHQ